MDRREDRLGVDGEAWARLEKPSLHVWDSRDYSPRDKLSLFCDVICAYGMPWMPRLPSPGDSLMVRDEKLYLERGVVERFSCAPLDMIRGNSQVSQSTLEAFFGIFVLSDATTLIRDGEQVTVNAGDFLLFDSAHPVVLRTRWQHLDTISFVLPKGASATFDKHSGEFRQLLITRERLAKPLRNCFYFLVDRLSRNTEETSAILDAILALVPVSAGCYLRDEAWLEQEPNALFREIISFIHQNLHDEGLSAKFVAVRFGISERYVFKLFAKRGLRFGSFVTSQRLETISAELRSRERRESISDLAYKWGFSDLSTFNRAFKKRFGQSPRAFQKQA